MDMDANHQAAIDYANALTLKRFLFTGPYDPGTPAHTYWLKQYDTRMMQLILY